MYNHVWSELLIIRGGLLSTVEELKTLAQHLEHLEKVVLRIQAKEEREARVGRLVQGMQDKKALLRFKGGKFGVARCTDYSGWRPLGLPATDDPAAALRVIQEEKPGD